MLLLSRPLTRIKAGRHARSILPTGLRGVGKTVLLNRFADEAEKFGFQTAFIEAPENGALPNVLAAHVRRMILDLNRGERFSAAAGRAMRVFRSFSVTLGADGLKLAVGVNPEAGVGDTGDLSIDLTDLFIALGEAALDRKTGIFIAVDEMQYLQEEEFAALIMAMHRISQKQLPIMLVGAGLPQLPALAGNAKSYAERLFTFPNVGPLSCGDARKAIAEPATAEGVLFEGDALDEIIRVTKGYPYFLQEWAYMVWNHARISPITKQDVTEIEGKVLRHLDQSFFRVRFDRLTPKERSYLGAMAEHGPGPHRSGDIAASLNMSVASVAPLRERLIRKGMIYSPSHGDAAFTVPLFDAFMRRHEREPTQ
jgi:hypothetical protein